MPCEPAGHGDHNGGTPRTYTIVIEKRDALSQAFSQLITVPNDADGAHVTFGGPFEWDNTDRARVTVTDATNCVATWTETLGVFVTFLPAPIVSINCAAGTSTIDIHTQLCPNGNLFSMDSHFITIHRYLDWSCMDDKDLSKVGEKTFALEHLISGVKDAYETKNRNYINFSLTLNK